MKSLQLAFHYTIHHERQINHLKLLMKSDEQCYWKENSVSSFYLHRCRFQFCHSRSFSHFLLWHMQMSETLANSAKHCSPSDLLLYYSWWRVSGIILAFTLLSRSHLWVAETVLWRGSSRLVGSDFTSQLKHKSNQQRAMQLWHILQNQK